MGRSALEIATTWDGMPLASAEKAVVTVVVEGGAVIVEVAAPFAGDPKPAGSGRTDRLWEHEVVEVFLAASATREAPYLELELGPHGHWLALGFSGYRALVDDTLVASFAARIDGARWTGTARIEAGEVAKAVSSIGAMNAYAIRGVGVARRYMAAYPAPAGAFRGPDFHRIELFR